MEEVILIIPPSRAHLHDYPQFVPFGRLLPNDLDILLEVIEELVQLSSNANGAKDMKKKNTKAWKIAVARLKIRQLIFQMKKRLLFVESSGIILVMDQNL